MLSMLNFRVLVNAVIIVLGVSANFVVAESFAEQQKRQMKMVKDQGVKDANALYDAFVHSPQAIYESGCLADIQEINIGIMSIGLSGLWTSLYDQLKKELFNMACSKVNEFTDAINDKIIGQINAGVDSIMSELNDVTDGYWDELGLGSIEISQGGGIGSGPTSGDDWTKLDCSSNQSGEFDTEFTERCSNSAVVIRHKYSNEKLNRKIIDSTADTVSVKGKKGSDYLNESRNLYQGPKSSFEGQESTNFKADQADKDLTEDVKNTPLFKLKDKLDGK